MYKVLIIILLSVIPFNMLQAKETSTVLAGGCFWCMESNYEKIDGVIKVESGYANSNLPNPTYNQVTSGAIKAVESVRIYYDDSKISYNEILTYFWYSIDPYDAKGQFCDKGYSYTANIFYANDTEKTIAEQSKKDMEKVMGKPFVTKIVALTNFTVAEEYHQDYYKKNPIRYSYYRSGCKRDSTLKSIWGDKAVVYKK